MTATKTLYRVIKRWTASYRPNDSETCWSEDVLYCGYDRFEAARVYHQNKPSESSHGYGNARTEILGQSMKVYGG